LAGSCHGYAETSFKLQGLTSSMLDIRRGFPWTGFLLIACAALVGCAPRTNVSATGDVPAQYSHFFVTTQAIWFNTDATATPDDSTWLQFTLTTPVTIDLATAVEGTLAQITTGLGVPAGTYAQVRLIPVDASAALTTSASSAGAIFNSEVDYVDTAGASQQSPLELQNPDKGIGIATTLQVSSSVGDSLGSTSTSSTSTTSTTGTTTSTFTPSSTGITGDDTDTTPTTTTTPTTSTSSVTLTPVSLAISVDGSRDLVPFIYSTVNPVNGYLFNPHVNAYAGTTVGAIQGSLTLTALTNITSASSTAYDDIQVTAETLSADGSRHQAVMSAPVTSSGTFVVYPLPTSSSTPTSYDLVIHGPSIATLIIKGIPVSVGAPATVTPVSIGTVTPRQATSFLVNLASTTTPPPAGALIGFYQTLPASGEVPYLIEERPMDPFNLNFASAQAISAQTIDTGTFVSGSNVTISTVTPTEGASTYRVSATAPLFTDGVLTSTVTGTGGSTAVSSATAPALTPESGAVSSSAQFTMTQTTPGKYNQGELIISHDGAIVATASLNTMLAQAGGGTLAISGLPGGTSSNVFAAGVYYVSVRTWNTSNPTETLNREIYPTALDLSSGNVTGFAVNID
jgi:hypothetical protein